MCVFGLYMYMYMNVDYDQSISSNWVTELHNHLQMSPCATDLLKWLHATSGARGAQAP